MASHCKGKVDALLLEPCMPLEEVLRHQYAAVQEEQEVAASLILPLCPVESGPDRSPGSVYDVAEKWIEIGLEPVAEEVLAHQLEFGGKHSSIIASVKKPLKRLAAFALKDGGVKLWSDSNAMLKFCFLYP